MNATSARPTPLPPWKRLLDLTCCLLALPFFLLATLAMTLILRPTSPGPVFFRQTRIGYKGNRFELYKFRTMKVNADAATHQAHIAQCVGSKAPLAKLDAKGDARLIPGGWLLRASGIDELPQIINIWRGDMSIVGPRPCLPYEYDTFFQGQEQRFAALPGLTGLWQVSGKNRTTFDAMVDFDIAYTRRMSLWLDLKIILLTIPALLVQIYDTKIGRKFAFAAPTRPGQPALAAPSNTAALSTPQGT